MSDLKTALTKLQDQFGDSIMLLSQQEVKPQPVIPTGSFSLDKALGIGGLPIGKISEVFGETGCLDEDTHIKFHCLDSDKNVFNDRGGTIKRLYERFNGLNKHHLQKDADFFTIPSIDKNNLIFHNLVHNVVKSGKKECFKLKSQKGFEIVATADHKFLTPAGYKSLSDLDRGSVIFVHNNSYVKKRRDRKYRKELYVKYHPSEKWKTIDNLKLMDDEVHNRLHTNQRERKIKIKAVKDSVAHIESVGIRNTYDIQCYAPHNNFIANNFVVHNSGKTTLALSVISQAQKKGHNCAFIDTEHVLDLNRARKIGVDLDRLIFSQPDYGEQALEMVDGLCRTGMVKVIVVDSVAALTPKAEIEGDMGDSPMASQARLMGQAMRKLVAVVNKMDVVLLFTNQVRSKISTFGYGGKVTTGGNSLKFYCSIRLDMAKKQEITEDDKVIASEHTIKIRKNKFAPPFKIIKTQIGERGFEWGAEILNEALKTGIIHRAGAYYKFNNDTIAQGKAATVREIESDEELANKLIAMLQD